MKYSNIVYNDVVNGEGMRISLFVQGCTHKCSDCFNKESWSFTGGKEFTQDTLNEMMNVFKIYSSGYDGLSILGGEPFDNLDLIELVINTFREQFHNTKDIWIWSGYTYEQLIQDKRKLNILSKCNILVDGLFKLNLYSPTLNYRGSSNQRVISVQNSLKQGTAVLSPLN